MRREQDRPFSWIIRLSSNRKFLIYSLLASSFVLIVSLVMQWVVYDDWLHQTGPLRIVGTGIAAAITFVFVLAWQRGVERREREMMQRMEMILEMNDKIRNALQAIECLTYLSQPEATAAVRESVNNIDSVLRQVLAAESPSRPRAQAAAVPPRQKSA